MKNTGTASKAMLTLIVSTVLGAGSLAAATTLSTTFDGQNLQKGSVGPVQKIAGTQNIFIQNPFLQNAKQEFPFYPDQETADAVCVMFGAQSAVSFEYAGGIDITPFDVLAEQNKKLVTALEKEQWDAKTVTDQNWGCPVLDSVTCQ